MIISTLEPEQVSPTEILVEEKTVSVRETKTTKSKNVIPKELREKRETFTSTLPISLINLLRDISADAPNLYGRQRTVADLLEEGVRETIAKAIVLNGNEQIPLRTEELKRGRPRKS